MIFSRCNQFILFHSLIFYYIYIKFIIVSKCNQFRQVHFPGVLYAPTKEKLSVIFARCNQFILYYHGSMVPRRTRSSDGAT